MEAKLSIIIPVYNIAGYLQTCLESILTQTFHDFEVILVDDGSTDETSAICDRYGALDSRITVVHKENEGVSIARNTGMEIATGEYYLFFDGDDFIEPYTLEELFQLAQEKQVDTIIYGYHRYEKGCVKETSYPIFREGYYEGIAIYRELIPRFIGISEDGINRWLKHEEKALYVENPGLWRTMVSGRIVKENSLIFDSNLKVGEDTIFISEYLNYAEKCYVHPKCYYYLVIRETSTIYLYEKNSLAKLEGKLKLLEARKELTEKILSQRGYDIEPTWRGTVIMSAIENAYLMAKKNPEYSYWKRFHMFLKYSKNREVQRIIRQYQFKPAPNVMIVPLILLKCKQYLLLFFCATLLRLTHFEFQRN